MLISENAQYRSNTIKFAYERLLEEEEQNRHGCENGQLILYWRAYLDGASAQQMEDANV